MSRVPLQFARHALVLAVALAALPGCATVGALQGDVKPFAPVPNAPGTHAAVAAQQAAAGGSIYAGANAGATSTGSIYAASQGPRLRLFEDNKARDVGDLLTIVLVESTESRTRANTAVTKDAGVGMGVPNIAGSSVTYKGRNILQAEVEGSREFAGGGVSTQSNELAGDITVTVVQQLPNGNLLVRGEKMMRLNQGDELVQVQGVVRPADIGPDNRIASNRIGDARIVYGGKGTLARSNAMGWLGRFFNSALFPY
ncbi:flagellar basal body L-ring protein FlgH [Cognatilysobacter bugurensis]|uniref:Flagellar L-ring protein n=1 Tax=Cognatilysobacter bugurensis TaxID=543356 RepID=A0A918WBV0_9GAMM|nr:flagellar basal body L-ring protein FlgH [Lysobacter bugurensis]GHA89356.1 flagellar L-ring protein [Lysobacter bugurensis]